MRQTIATRPTRQRSHAPMHHDARRAARGRAPARSCAPHYGLRRATAEPPLPEALRRNARRGDFPGPCPRIGGVAGVTEVAEKAPFLPLSQTTERVLRILIEGDLARLRAESVAEQLGISCTTLRRRLRSDHTSYQFLLDRARQFRCEASLQERWLPGKCLADELGYLEVNSFYRAFQRWTGMNYSDYKLRYL